MRTNRILNTILFFMPFLLLQCSNDIEELTFEDFDQNGNMFITLEEFQEVFADYYYGSWNPDNAEYLKDDDFLQATYRIWDEDKDEKLTEEEYTRGFDYSYGNYIVNDFEGLDSDRDGYIGYNEYSIALMETSFYLDWDIHNDKKLDEEDLAAGIFAQWDIDQSGLIEIDEFKRYKDYYLNA